MRLYLNLFGFSVISLSLIAGLCLTMPALADDKKQLLKIEEEIKQRDKNRAELEKQAKDLQKQKQRLRQKIIRLATKLQESEQRQNELADEIEKLGVSETTILAKLDRDRQELSKSLGALQKFEKQLPPPFAINPDDALAGIRGAIAISGIVPTLQNTADQLKKQLEELTTIRAYMSERREVLKSETAQAQKDRLMLAELVQEKTRAEKRTQIAIEKEAAAIQKLARQARSLRDLVDRLEARRETTKKFSNFRNAKGRLPLPVSGTVLSQARTQKLNEDLGRDGLYIRTGADMLVTAPFDATILYAGKFRDYGNILILGVGDNHHLLFAGLGPIDAQVNQQVLAGEPIARMGGQMSGPIYATQSSRPNHGKETLTLYVEIRYKGKPISPNKWFRS
ncbi:MAG: murein hydrolase activator EnvC family protein [Parvibaculales bacterium]